MNDSAIEVEGICSFPAEPDGYNGIRLTKSEMESKLTEMVGQPILEEHGGEQIGKVKGGVIEDDQIKAFIEVSRDNIEGIKAISKLRDGTLKGLSLGIEFLFDMGEEKRVVAKDMKELSLTSNPDCPTAIIKNVGSDSQLWVAKTNFWTKKLKNEKLEKDLYKSFKVLREVGESRRKMGDVAPEKEATENAEATTEKVADLNEKSSALEEKSQFYQEELLRIKDLFGGEEAMKAIIKEQMKQREKSHEEMTKQRKLAGDYITMLAEKEPDKTELVEKARAQLDKEQGDTFLRVLGLAKARHENSQSNIEKAFQNSKSEKQKEKEMKNSKEKKWRDELYSKKRKQSFTKGEERPAKKQKTSSESPPNRWDIGLPPAAIRSKMTTPNLKGAKGHFNDEQYHSIFD